MPEEPFVEAARNQPPLIFSPGEIVAERFRVLRFIGRGGMGEVYEARDLDLGTRVALKTIRQEISADLRTLLQFKQEIELARRVTHRNVCRIFDLEHHKPPPGSGKPDITLLTMELLDGERLADRLRREGRMRPEKALPLIRQMAEALAAAHQAGVIHRDFKPGNVMLVAETPTDPLDPAFSEQETQSVDEIRVLRRPPTDAVRAVITDFGLAQPTAPAPKAGALSPTLLGEAGPAGTPPYMAPEQLEGREITPATDVYALGLVMYEMLAGQLPFANPTSLAGAVDRLKGPAPSPRILAPELDSRVESIILRCLEIQPASRYASAGEVVEALEGVNRGEAETAGFPVRLLAGIHSRYHRATRVEKLLLLALSAGLASVLTWLARRAPTPPITVSSRAALNRYLRASELYEQIDLPGSIGLARSALQMDPGFAMAHLLLARDYDELGDDTNARQELAAARQQMSRVTEREKYLIQAYDDYYENVFQKALEEYRADLQLYPEDLEALRGVARTARWIGQSDEAIAAGHKVLNLRRHYARDYEELMDLLIGRSRFAEALETYKDAQSHSVNISGLHWPAALAYWGQGDLTSARRELELLRRSGGTRNVNLAALYSARILQYEGRMREADDALRAGLILDQQQHSDTWVPLRLYLLVKGDLARGDAGQAQADDHKLVAAESWGAEDFQMAGLASLEVGRLDAARRFLSSLDELRSKRNSVFTQSWYYGLEGDVHAAEGRLDEAAASERQALLLLPADAPYLSLGKISMKSENWRGAIDAYEKYLSLKGEVLHFDCSIDWVTAQLQVARACVKLGDRTRAKLYYDRFLSLWADADATLPLLLQARQERQALDRTN